MNLVLCNMMANYNLCGLKQWRSIRPMILAIQKKGYWTLTFICLLRLLQTNLGFLCDTRSNRECKLSLYQLKGNMSMMKVLIIISCTRDTTLTKPSSGLSMLRRLTLNKDRAQCHVASSEIKPKEWCSIKRIFRVNNCYLPMVPPVQVTTDKEPSFMDSDRTTTILMQGG